MYVCMCVYVCMCAWLRATTNCYNHMYVCMWSNSLGRPFPPNPCGRPSWLRNQIPPSYQPTATKKTTAKENAASAFGDCMPLPSHLWDACLFVAVPIDCCWNDSVLCVSMHSVTPSSGLDAFGPKAVRLRCQGRPHMKGFILFGLEL